MSAERTPAAQMLFAIGASLVTFIGVVFSLLFLVVQFGSSTFTPRLDRRPAARVDAARPRSR
jgi:uncharacterized membrane protein